MNTNLLWKVALIVAVLVIFTVAIIPTKNNPEPIRRGLDLKGGTHLVMRVNVGDAVRLETDQAMEQLKTQATKNTLPPPTTRRINDATFVATPPSGVAPQRLRPNRGGLQERVRREQHAGGRDPVQDQAASVSSIERDTISRAVETIRNRVDALGVTEPIIAPESGNRIVIDLPSIDDPARVKDIIKTTAQLQFRLVEGSPASDAQAVLATVPPNMKNDVDIMPGTRENDLGQAIGTDYYAVRKVVPVTGTDLKNARVQKGRLGEPVIGFSMTADGARKFGDLTGANVGRQLAIVLDNKIQSAPRINSRIDDQGVIEGRFTQQQAADLALVLRSGSLPASLTHHGRAHRRASLGRDSIHQGVLASLIGFIALISRCSSTTRARASTPCWRCRST